MKHIISSQINKCLAKDGPIKYNQCSKIITRPFIPTLPTIQEIKIHTPNIVCNKVDVS